MGNKEQIILAFAGFIIGIILSIWIITQIPHLEPIGFAIISFVFSLVLVIIGWRSGKTIQFIN